MAEDVGIFSDPRFKERWVFPADGEFSDSATGENADSNPTGNSTAAKIEEPAPSRKPYQLNVREPVYVYSAFSNDAKALSSAKSVFDHLDQNNLFPAPVPQDFSADAETPKPRNFSADAETESSDSKGRIQPVEFVTVVPKPPADAFQALSKKYEADTICFAHAKGQRFTTARKTGGFAIAVLAGLLTGGLAVAPVPADFASVSMTCYDATGTLVWGGNQPIGDPEKPSAAGIKNLLAYFPAKGQLMDARCKSETGQPTSFKCSAVTQSETTE